LSSSDEPARAPVISAAPASAPAAGWRILVAEDMAVNQMVARGLLEARGHRVDIAADGAEAIAKADDNDYDLILMDMQMPRMDGLQATRVIRARGGRLASVPIVAMTANAFASDQGACLDAGMNAFIAKPINAEKLHEILNRVMRGQSTDAGSAESADFSREPIDTLLRQLGVSEVDAIIRCFRAEVPALLARIQRSCVDGSATDRAAPLRLLQTVLANLGFVAAAACCRAELETLAAGMRPNPDFVSTLDQLITAGLGSCENIISNGRKASPLLASAA
jgi:CheY-like chemotaxis protein